MSAIDQSFARAPSGFLVATDGTHDSDGAVRVGLALAHRDGVTADVFSVVEPLPVVDSGGVALPDVDHLIDLARESRGAALLAQRDRTHPGIHEWPYTVDVGNRAETIVARAARNDASLIVLGLGAHGVSARLRQRETALRVIRAATKPVLAVPRDAWGVPHSMLAAIDFTASSEHAAKAALDLLDKDGSLYLAYVSPRIPIPHGDSRPWDEITTNAVVPHLEAIARRLAPSPGIQIEYTLLYGDPAHELLAFAKEFQIDMVSAGAHGRSALGRLMLGSVSTKLIRTAGCWVLVAPPRPDTAPTAPELDRSDDWT